MTTPPSGQLAGFTAQLPFSLDDFQQRACAALERGHGVLVAAPTGAGKTVVGEFAVHLALAQGGKCFYTTPIKALSNQKFADLSRGAVWEEVIIHLPDSVSVVPLSATVSNAEEFGDWLRTVRGDTEII